jgi:hypothetical protein
MTSCLNHDYLILISIHFPYLLYENPSFIIVSAETDETNDLSLHIPYNISLKYQSHINPFPVQGKKWLIN